MPTNDDRHDRPGRWLSLGQVFDFQDEMVFGLGSDLSGLSDRLNIASALSNLGKSFASLQDAKREILGKPKAVVLQPENRQTKRNRTVTGPIECEVPKASAGATCLV